MAVGVLITPAQDAANKAAAAYFTSGKDVKVDAGGVRKHTETLARNIADGIKLLPFAQLYGATSKSKAGKVVADGSLARRWRHADYIVKATEYPDILSVLTDGYALTGAAVAKLCQEAKPLMVEAGILKDKGRKAETVEARQSAWCDRIVKRIDAATKSGVKASAGATSDIPAWDAVNMVYLKLQSKVRMAAKMRAKMAAPPHEAETDGSVTTITLPEAVNG